MARRADLQVGPELDQPVAVPRGLRVGRSRVRASGERAGGAGEEAPGGRVECEAAPPPRPAASALVERNRQPATHGPRREVDAVDAARRSGSVAVGGSRHVHRPAGKCERAPVQLGTDVREETNGPAGPLGAGREREGMQPAERVRDVERPRRLIDHACADDAVAVELRAAVGELPDLVAPEHEAVPVEGDDVAARARRDEHTAGGQHLCRDPARERQHEPARDVRDRRGRRSFAEPGGARAESRPGRRLLHGTGRRQAAQREQRKHCRPSDNPDPQLPAQTGAKGRRPANEGAWHRGARHRAEDVNEGRAQARARRRQPAFRQPSNDRPAFQGHGCRQDRPSRTSRASTRRRRRPRDGSSQVGSTQTLDR